MSAGASAPFLLLLFRCNKKGGLYGHLCCFGVAGGPMAHFARLIIFVLLFASVNVCHGYGITGVIPTQVWTCTGYTGQQFTGSSPEAACTSASPPYSGQNSGFNINRTYTVGSCTINGSVANCVVSMQECDYWIGNGQLYGCGTTNGINAVAYGSQTNGCGDNAVVGGTDSHGATSCGCPQGYMPGPNSSCVPYTCPSAGGYSAVTQPDQLVSTVGASMCSSGCGYTPSSYKADSTGKIWATWPFVSTGQSCGGAPIPGVAPTITSGNLNSQNPAPIPCGANMCPGSVNGQNVCVACASQATAPQTTTTSSTSGGASGAAGTTSTQQQQTSCDGANCTTTTTTTNTASDGSVLGTTTQQSQQTQLSFCQENPSNALCKSSAFNGSCSGGFSCSGDPIACATAQAAQKQLCDLETADPGLVNVANAAVAGGLHPDGHPYNSATSNSLDFSSTIDTSDSLGAGSCPSDESISFAGTSVTLPWSQFCGSLNIAGQIAVAVSMLAAAMIVFKR